MNGSREENSDIVIGRGINQSDVTRHYSPILGHTDPESSRPHRYSPPRYRAKRSSLHGMKIHSKLTSEYIHHENELLFGARTIHWIL